MAALRHGLARGDAAEAVRRAHSVAGSAVMVGATDVAREARAILDRLRAGEAPGTVLPAVGGLETALASLGGELRRLAELDG